MSQQEIRIFTWHIHGSYLYYLSQANLTIYIPVATPKREGYVGRGQTFPFGSNVIEVPEEDVKDLELDCILYQTNKNFLSDQFDILSAAQRKLPRIYLEHDPPREHPTDTIHAVTDKDVLVVHVTHFNQLMWNNTGSSTVIEHGVTDPGIQYKGIKNKGLVVINNLPERGRLLGFDVFNKVREKIPLDLIGMGTEKIGLGEVLHPQLPEFVSEYRFFFNPIRYTSFGLAVCEAMMIGIPVIGLATTEMPSVFINQQNGIIHTDIEYLVQQMQELLENPERAKMLGEQGRLTAQKRFTISRFKNDWEQIIHSVINNQNSDAVLRPSADSGIFTN